MSDAGSRRIPPAQGSLDRRGSLRPELSSGSVQNGRLEREASSGSVRGGGHVRRTAVLNDQYLLGEELGRGAYGQVRAAAPLAFSRGG